MPTFMGTLQLNESGAVEAPAPVAKPTEGTAATLAPDDVGPLHGRKLETGLSIVLENVAAGFTKPNILDIKLGAQLYDVNDEKQKPEKRARFDKVSKETTSGSLGFRIAGMRVWQGPALGAASELQGKKAEGGDSANDLLEHTSLDADGYRSYNKIYGRKFSADDIDKGFKEYLIVPSANITEEKAKIITNLLLKHTLAIQQVLEQEESRMFSASILYVYEGDGEAFDATLKANPKLGESIEVGEEETEEEDDEEEENEAPKPKLVAAKLIDFAHANWVPGQGPDTNSLQGVVSAADILKRIAGELASK